MDFRKLKSFAPTSFFLDIKVSSQYIFVFFLSNAADKVLNPMALFVITGITSLMRAMFGGMKEAWRPTRPRTGSKAELDCWVESELLGVSLSSTSSVSSVKVSSSAGHLRSQFST